MDGDLGGLTVHVPELVVVECRYLNEIVITRSLSLAAGFVWETGKDSRFATKM